MRSTSELRERLMQRHGKRLHVPIDLRPSPAKKVCLNRGGKAPAPEVPAPPTTRSDGDGASISAPVPPDAAGFSMTAMVQADALGRSSLAVVGTSVPKKVSEAPNGEDALVEKSIYTVAVPPSWEELMNMLKGVPCFTDAEVWHPLGISKFTVPCNQLLQGWTMPEVAEVVNTYLLFFSCLLVITTFPCNFVCYFIVALPRLYPVSTT